MGRPTAPAEPPRFRNPWLAPRLLGALAAPWRCGGGVRLARHRLALAGPRGSLLQQPLRVMIVDENAERAARMEAELVAGGCEVVARLLGRLDLRERVAEVEPDVIIVDMPLEAPRRGRSRHRWLVVLAAAECPSWRRFPPPRGVI